MMVVFGKYNIRKTHAMLYNFVRLLIIMLNLMYCCLSCNKPKPKDAKKQMSILQR
jgi:hypothetical protein